MGWHALLVDLADRGPSRAADLAEERGVTKGVISRQLRELARLGLIEQRPDETDARAKVLVLSRRGQGAVARAEELRQEVARRLISGTTSEELAEVVRSLARLNDLLE